MKSIAPDYSETHMLKAKMSRLTSNPFVNFFLDLCKHRDGLNLEELAEKAGMLWKQMNNSEKRPYYKLAREVKKSRGKRKPRKKKAKRKKARHVDPKKPPDAVGGDKNTSEKKKDGSTTDTKKKAGVDEPTQDVPSMTSLEEAAHNTYSETSSMDSW